VVAALVVGMVLAVGGPVGAAAGRADGSLDEALRVLVERLGEASTGEYFGMGRAIAEHNDPRAIPVLIGAIDADNSYETVYGLGYFGLSPLTGVEYSPYHDGAWWRRWWARNRERFPADVRAMEIPDLPKTAHGRGYEPFPESLETLDGKIAFMLAGIREGGALRYSDIAGAIADHGDPRAIPAMIGMIIADDTYDTVYGIGYFGLTPLTGVEYDDAHDGAWWRRWWDEHRGDYPEEVAALEIPEVELPGAAEPEFLHAGGNARMRYLLHGAADAPEAGDGVGLLLVLPGGDGSAEFAPFVEHLSKNVVPRGVVVAHLIAPVWDERQKNDVVWPTRRLPYRGMEFTTEEFMGAVVADVSGRVRIDPERVYAMGWSSGGPPVYAGLCDAEVGLSGAVVVMSVFKGEQIPAIETARGKRVAIVHSPTDFIRMSFPQAAVRALKDAGAEVRLSTYEGGHGWHGESILRVREALAWVAEERVDAGDAEE
ncbi:MAG: alpha/beta hydrolase, partial [Phycisphaerales bacterium]